MSPNPRIQAYVERAVELCAGEIVLDPLSFMAMLMDVRDEARAVDEALRDDRSDAAIKVRFAAKLLCLYVDDALRAVGVNPAAKDPVATARANDAAGRVVNYAVALRDIYRHAYA